MKEPFKLLRECRDECGDAFLLRLLGLGEWVFLCSPALAEEMFKAPEAHLSAADFNLEFLAHLLGADSTIAKDGPEHRARRGLLSGFLNGKKAAGHTALSLGITEEAIDSWPVHREFSLLPHTTNITLRLLIAAITGVHERTKLDRLVMLADHFFETALKSRLMLMPPLQWDLGRYSPWGHILWLRQNLRDALSEEINDRRRQGVDAHRDILSALIATEDSTGQALSNDTIVDEVINLVSAGQETSSRILVWAIRGILSRPDALAGLRGELSEVLGDRPIGEDDLGQLRYLEAVINEGIRYQPLGPFTGARRARKPWTLGGFLMPEGALVAHCHAEISQRDDLFDQPDGFHPKNFFDRTFEPFTWCPFGGGARTCLGRGLALMHLKVVLATVLQRTELKLCQTDVEPVSGGFLLVPEKGLMVELETRYPM